MRHSHRYLSGIGKFGTGFRGRGGVAFLALITLLTAAWRDVSGNTINPQFVSRIKNGVTTKHEILLWFGDPQEISRSPEGPVFRYSSYRDAPQLPSIPERQIDEQVTTPYVLDENKKIKKAPVKKAGKILRSTLVVRFKPDGMTVMSYEYQEH